MNSGLCFDEQDHRYSFNGTPVMSVTQAIKGAGLIDGAWYTEFARQRGKAVHLATQFDDEGVLDEETVSPVILPYLQASRRFKQETGFRPDLIESRICVLNCGYAGTFDRIGMMGKERTIVDYKSGELPFWCAMQTAAYANALPNGASLTRYGVQLKPDGTYKIERYDVRNFRSDLNDFLACVRVHQIRVEKGMEAL